MKKKYLCIGSCRLMLLCCKNSGDDNIKALVPGTCMNPSMRAISKAPDTIRIEKPGTDGNRFLIMRAASFRRI